MKIAFIVDLFPSISETFILNQITKLTDLGHHVTIFSASRSNEQCCHPDVKKYGLMDQTYYHNDRPENKFIRILAFLYIFISRMFKYPLPLLRSLNFFKYGRNALSLTFFYKAVLFLNTGPFDIIQCHFGPNGNLGAFLKELGIPGKLVVMFHGYDIRKGLKVGGHIYKNLFNNTDALLSISRYNYDNLVKLGADPLKIRHLPVGIDLRVFPFKKYSTTGHDKNTINIITVARLLELKGLQYSIKAVSELIFSRNIKNIHYQIVGDGPFKEKLQELIIELSLNEYVDLIGAENQAGINMFLQKSDIYMLPSLEEALPVTLMEACAAGLPVITTSVGSVGEIVINDETGFIVPRADVTSLAKKLEYLISHRELWEEMGRKGRENIEKKYDIDKLVVQLADIYSSLNK